MRYIGIGWDVGGWMGAANAFALAAWDSNSKQLGWLMEPRCIQIPSDEEFSLEYVLSLGNLSSDQVLDSNVTVGVDAPLAFPVDFVRLVGGANGIDRKPSREIDNRLAYRTTERWVYQTFDKKPLSAPFDKLGNNSTLAIAAIRRWKAQHQFALMAFDQDNRHRVIIEVYPKLLAERAFDGIRGSIICHIPKRVLTETDEYDACLAALNAIALRASEGNMPLPELIRPPHEHAEAVKKEGWIYCFAAQ